ncbi:MAG: aminotransferase [Candidatus Aenigmatarchaeota archaeon]|nr:MAG: aminotransferase [Candidatus Aenigmarchaeota archaeon]
MIEGWAYAERTKGVKSSIIREILKLINREGVISFAGGLPAPDLFPLDELEEACHKVFKNKAGKALQYGTTEGYYPLRDILAKWVTEQGIEATADDIMITTASQQGLDLVSKLFLDLGDNIITSAPTYLGAIQAFNAYSPRYITFKADEHGIKIDGLEEAIQKGKPRFIYLVPTFQNPDGRTLSLERRKKILALAREYKVPIIEDDPYSQLRYKGEDIPAMKALDPDCVILLGTFSKLIAPGFRVGWAIAPSEPRDKLIRLKQGADLHTSTFSQYVLYEFLSNGGLKRHLDRVKKVYARKLRVMKEGINRYFPDGVKVIPPEGGLFLWVELPKGLDTAELLQTAVEKGVAYIPGKYFYPDGSGENTCRLNFSFPSEGTIEEGVKRLGEFFKKALLESG